MRKEIIKKIRNEKKLIAAVFPVHYPRELLRAFDIHPVEVWGPPKSNVSLSGKHLQSYVCSVIQSSLSFIVKGGLKGVDMILVPHSCDSLQGFGSILIDYMDLDIPVLTFYIPRGKREEDLNFLVDEIKRVYEELSNFFGKKPSEEKLMEKILKEEEVDLLIEKAYLKHIEFKTESFEFYEILRLREYLPQLDFKKFLENFLGARHEKRNSKIPIIISGVLPEPMEIFRYIEDEDGVVIDDDFLSIKRRIYGKGKSNDPFLRMAERLLFGHPDTTKGSSFLDRLNFLLELVKKSDAKGFVFYNVKFCEPESFYYPIIRSELKKMGISSILIEVDINEGLPYQGVTKIGALIESIKGRKNNEQI